MKRWLLGIVLALNVFVVIYAGSALLPSFLEGKIGVVLTWGLFALGLFASFIYVAGKSFFGDGAKIFSTLLGVFSFLVLAVISVCAKDYSNLMSIFSLE